MLGEAIVDIEADGWGYTKSWHLEVNAPEGLRVAALDFETWDTDTLEITASGHDGGDNDTGTGTAHVTAADVAPYDDFFCQVRFVPNQSALLNPLTLGATLGSALLWLTWVFAGNISEKLLTLGGNGAPLGAIVFGLPALFFAMLTRSDEHELVSKVLLGPRLASLGCALSLWVAGVVVVWAPAADTLRWFLAVLAIVHTVMLSWLLAMRLRN